MGEYKELFDLAKKPYSFLTHDNTVLNSTSNTYPHSNDYEYFTYIECVDFDEECDNDIRSGNGFIIAPSGRNIKKDLNSDEGIFSSKFGQTLADANPYMDQHKCKCGKLKGRFNKGLRCPHCGTLCEFIGNNFSYFGWMKLKDPYMIIHSAYYKKIEAFLGKGISIQGQKRTKLENILDITETAILITTSKNIESKLKDEPFFGIGMMEFINRFDEIMDFYLKKVPTRKSYYDDIMKNRKMVFTHSIPVFTTLLRPFDISDGSMSYEPTNAMYAMMNKLVTHINKTATAMQREPKIKNQQLYNLQKKFMELYNELEDILSGKKGDFRCLLGGRYNFSSRNVIAQNPNLRIDEITLPIIGLTILLEQRIKNILCRTFNMSPTEAHDIWYKATIEPDKRVSAIVQSIIDDCKSKGMPGIGFIINRNPSISYGSILFVFCVGFTESYTMAVSLQVLKPLAADFDGRMLPLIVVIQC